MAPRPGQGTYSDFIIIETHRPFYTAIDMTKDPEFAKLKQHEVAGTLPEQKNATIQPKAGLYQKPNMLEEEYVDEEDGFTKKKRFKDSVILAAADSRGRIFIEKENVALARNILKVLLRIDKTVGIDPASALTFEEIMGPPKVNKGGRPRKV